jgi:hypothetical protein
MFSLILKKLPKSKDEKHYFVNLTTYLYIILSYKVPVNLFYFIKITAIWSDIWVRFFSLFGAVIIIILKLMMNCFCG